ncbi:MULTISPECIES: DMT family transporter [Catenuloplanes]|uniref:DME family drug/metabolite transporter n=1 Tax=Catenuloplanes niger TaxID=587534 RepID=A0AAE3ZWB8_9ACTN|nr:DMT family transporter [Catenuloplanes niger]MDR7325065.1 DME family drug/metabolite transporter [Catenuloplanes niger]
MSVETSAPTTPSTASPAAPEPNHSRRGMALIALAAMAWGTGGAAAAVLYRTSGLGPIAVSYWRFVIGALALAAYLAARTARHRTPARRASAREAGETGETGGARDVGETGDARDASTTGDARETRGEAGLDVTDGYAAFHGGAGPAAHPGDRRAGAVRTRRRVRRLLMVAATGVGLAVYQSAFYVSIAETGLAVATVVTLGAGPILIAVGARVFLAERLGHAGAAAIALALAGLIALSLDSGTTGPRPALGIGYALLSALGYAVVTLVGRTPGSAGDPFRTSLTGFVVGGIVLTPFALADGVLPATGGLPVTIGWLLYLGVVASALAYGLFFAGLAHVGATTAAVVTLLEPVAAALLAVAFLGEHLTPAVLTGMLLLLGAVAVLAYPARR